MRHRTILWATVAAVAVWIATSVGSASAQLPGTTLVPGKPTRIHLVLPTAQLLAQARAANAKDELYFSRLEATGNPADIAVAAGLRRTVGASLDRALTALEGNSAAWTGQDVPFIPLLRQAGTPLPGVLDVAASGGLSGFSYYTYPGPEPVDPQGFITNWWTNSAPSAAYNGSDAAIRGDLESPASPSSTPWQDGGGAVLFVMICSDGVCNYQEEDYNLQILDANATFCTPTTPVPVCTVGPACPDPQFGGTDQHCPRKHISLWGNRTPDSANSQYTVGDAHHDIYGHACPDDWNGTRDYVYNSIPPADIGSYGTEASGASGQLYTAGCLDGQYVPATFDGIIRDQYMTGYSV